MNCILCGSKGKIFYQRTNNGDCILKCLQCGMLFVNPQPTQEQLEEFYRDFDSGYQLKYKDQVIKRSKKIFDLVQKFRRNGRLLDVGCGYGFFLDIARKNGWQATGLELSPAAADFAKRNLGLQVFIGELAKINLEENYFDLISMQHVLEHLPDPVKILNILKTKLKDGGILLLIVPNASSLMARWAKINWLCLMEKSHLFHYNQATLKKLLEISGFRILFSTSFQWSTQRLLWAFKVFIVGHKKSKEDVRLEEEISCYPQENNRLFKNLIIKIVSPFNWIVEKLSLGEEIVVLARKGLQ